MDSPPPKQCASMDSPPPHPSPSPSQEANGSPTDHQQPQPPDKSQWSTGLYDCKEDRWSCCLALWCPCIAFGQIAEILDEGYFPCECYWWSFIYFVVLGLIGYPCCFSWYYRGKMRQKYNLEESPCGDCWLHGFCEQCALCQEYRELKHRGLDPALGWKGNLRRQQITQEGMGIVMNAPASQTMD